MLEEQRRLGSFEATVLLKEEEKEQKKNENENNSKNKYEQNNPEENNRANFGRGKVNAGTGISVRFW